MCVHTHTRARLIGPPRRSTVGTSSTPKPNGDNTSGVVCSISGKWGKFLDSPTLCDHSNSPTNIGGRPARYHRSRKCEGYGAGVVPVEF